MPAKPPSLRGLGGFPEENALRGGIEADHV
jgi:hypothetical protein